MRKKILSIYLAVAIGFLSVVASVIPAYASSSPEWSDYFEITYSSSDINSPYSLEFKDSKAQVAYKNLSKDERKKIDYDAFMAISAKDQNYKFGNLAFNNTTIPDLIKGIAASSGMVMSGAPDDTGFTADLQDKLTKISNSISASNRKFGGKGISCKASSTHPNNFGLGTLTLSKDFINDLRSNVATNYGYKIYPALPSNPVDFYELYNYPKKDSDYDEFVEYWSDKSKMYSFVCFVPQSWSTDYLGFYVMKEINYFSDKVFFLDQYNRMSYFFTDGSLSSGLVDADYRIALNANGTVFGIDGRINPTNFIGVTGRSLVVYNNKESAKNHLIELLGQSKPSIFIANNSVNNDYSTTVNKIYNYANGGYTDVIQGQIDKAITDKGSGLTEEEYQKIVNEVFKKVQTEIDSQPDSGDSGNTGGGSGGDSGNTGGSSGGDSGNTGGGESNTWLEKIYNRLGDILEKIGTVTGVDTLVSLVQQIADDIKTLKDGGTLSADLSDTNGLLKDIKKLLGTLIAVQAAGDVADLLTDTVGDKISDFVDNLKSGVSEVTDALQDVFPFSIPWDLMTILALFSAEPQAPVFDIPVNIPQLGVEHSIHVDLSDFESVSVICRAFLSLSFAVGLMYLTIRITGGKDDD